MTKPRPALGMETVDVVAREEVFEAVGEGDVVQVGVLLDVEEVGVVSVVAAVVAVVAVLGDQVVGVVVVVISCQRDGGGGILISEVRSAILQFCREG